jgi:hypothetical protein
MGNERLILAIGQMERALSRLEMAQAKLRDAPQKSDHGSQSDALLKQRFDSLTQDHQLLKSAASQALAQIDALLDSEGQENHA